MFIINQEAPTYNFKNGGFLFQAVLRLEEIRDIFRSLNICEEDIEYYAEDYVNRLYLLKIKNIILYLPIRFLITLIGSTTGTTFISGVTQRGTSVISEFCIFLWDEPEILATKINHDGTIITNLKNPNHYFIYKNHNMISFPFTTLTFGIFNQILIYKTIIHFYLSQNNNP